VILAVNVRDGRLPRGIISGCAVKKELLTLLFPRPPLLLLLLLLRLLLWRATAVLLLVQMCSLKLKLEFLPIDVRSSFSTAATITPPTIATSTTSFFAAAAAAE
jgi:hypothetical protein